MKIRLNSSASVRPTPAMRWFFERVFPLLFIALGAAAVYFGWRILERARESTGWPTAEGIVLESSVERRVSRDGDGDSVTYHAEVFYEFSTGGQTYNGNRVSYGDYGSSNPSHARGVVNRYPPGARVTVYFLPGNPSECVLVPGATLATWILPGVGLIFFTAGCAMAVLLPKALRIAAAQER